jgi:3-hydroxyacyl-[acyl-carrier-protein] dehydratase
MTAPLSLLEAALKQLPHGKEFRFVDRLTALEPGRTGVGEYTVREEAPFLRGHFPGRPILPGVLLVEAGAQLAGTVAQCDPELAPLPGLKLTAIRGIKILGTAEPGATVVLEAAITGRLGNLVQAHVRASLEGRTLMEGALTLSGTAPQSAEGTLPDSR